MAIDDENYPRGRFVRPDSGDEIEVTRPAGITYPLDVKVAWVSPGEGRAALDKVLGGVFVLEVDHLAQAVAAGQDFTIDALRELARRPATRVISRLSDRPLEYSLETEGEREIHTGPRLDLLLTLELMVRCALRPFKDVSDPPKWVLRARPAHASLLKALGGQPLFVKVT